MKYLMTALAYIALLTGSYAYAAHPLSPFVGHWRGKAIGKVADGKQENFICTTTNSLQPDNTLRIRLRCAHAGASLYISAEVRAHGSALSGTWEVRTYNVSGSLLGTLSGDTITARIDSPNYAATIRIVRKGGTLSVSISSSKGSGSFAATFGS